MWGTHIAKVLTCDRACCTMDAIAKGEGEHYPTRAQGLALEAIEGFISGFPGY
jgi:hypothetical protein